MISPDRLAALIAGWTHEAEVAEANQRADEYASMCRDTVEALKQLEHLRRMQSGKGKGLLSTCRGCGGFLNHGHVCQLMATSPPSPPPTVNDDFSGDQWR